VAIAPPRCFVNESDPWGCENGFDACNLRNPIQDGWKWRSVAREQGGRSFYIVHLYDSSPDHDRLRQRFQRGRQALEGAAQRARRTGWVRVARATGKVAIS